MEARMNQGTFEELAVQEQAGKAKAFGAELERRLKGVAAGIDRKHLAAVCDVSYSYMSEVLNSNNEDHQKRWQICFTGALMVLAPDLLAQEALDFVLEVIGRKPSEEKPRMSAEEELRLLKEKIAKHGLEAIFK
jgi:hypothetical protein